MRMIGYARVSTDEQSLVPQRQALKAAGCSEIVEEHASGGSRARPGLARLMNRIAAGDTLVVMRMDRLARSLSHLLEIIEALEARGAHFRSLEDPIDTTLPQGRFTLQVLGAAAEFERALIRERTRAGLASAREAGRIGGNPGLKAREPAALRKLKLARHEAWLMRLNARAEDWVPEIRRLRPHARWEDVLRVINARLPPERHWSLARLTRAARAWVSEGLLAPEVLQPAPRRAMDDRLPALIAAMKGADPELTLAAMRDRLDAMREPTPRGRGRWQISSVAMLVKRAERLGLLPAQD